MFFGAKPKTFEKARALRFDMTEAERILWKRLRKNQMMGFRFKRQHPIGQFIVDFYCHKARLVIEIDGGIHLNRNQKEYDKERTYELENFGLKVLRFKNDLVYQDPDKVVNEIGKYLLGLEGKEG
ncbi:MAG: endonuclease domain-containing protein [Bacteroidales bacterium]|nr:endonuclease domain-containing protein [Bacteroidales bacterium]